MSAKVEYLLCISCARNIRNLSGCRVMNITILSHDRDKICDWICNYLACHEPRAISIHHRLSTSMYCRLLRNHLSTINICTPTAHARRRWLTHQEDRWVLRLLVHHTQCYSLFKSHYLLLSVVSLHQQQVVSLLWQTIISKKSAQIFWAFCLLDDYVKNA